MLVTTDIQRCNPGEVMRTIAIIAATALGLAGCTTIPKIAQQSAISPAEIHDAVQCEIAYAIENPSSGASAFADWVAAIQLEITLTDSIGMKPGLNFTGSLGKAEYKVPASLDYSDVRKGHAILAYDALTLTDAHGGCPERGSGASAKGLGLAEWLERAGDTMTFANSDGGTLTKFGYTMTFSVTRSVGGGLTFKTDHVSVSLDENQLSHENENILTIAFAKPDKDARSTVKKLQNQINLERAQENTIQLKPGQSIIVQ